MLKIPYGKSCTKTAFFILSLVIFFNNSYGQSEDDIKRLRELGRRNREIYDSINKNDEIRKNRAEYRDIIARSKSWAAFTMGYELSHASLGNIKADLQANGMVDIKSTFQAVVIGYSRQNKRVTGNLLFNFGIGNSTSNPDYSVRLGGSGATFDKGYAFINTRNFIFHPFAGIGFLTYTLRVSEKNSTTVPVNGLPGIAQGPTYGRLTQNIFHGIIGAQFDYNLGYRKVSNAGLQLGIRFAYNPVFVKGKYIHDTGDSQYKPAIGWRQYNLSLLLKIFSRTYFH